MMGFHFFNKNKNLQITQLLLIFVDILPKVGAVHFTEFSTSNDVVVVLQNTRHFSASQQNFTTLQTYLMERCGK